MKKTAPGNPKTLEIITPNEIIVKFWFLRMFYTQLWKIEWMGKSSELTKTDVSENHQKINVNVTAGVWQNRGGALFEIAMAAVRSKLLSFLLKKHWFLCETTNPEFWPDWVSRRTLKPLTLFGELKLKAPVGSPGAPW